MYFALPKGSGIGLCRNVHLPATAVTYRCKCYDFRPLCYTCKLIFPTMDKLKSHKRIGCKKRYAHERKERSRSRETTSRHDRVKNSSDRTERRSEERGRSRGTTSRHDREKDSNVRGREERRREREWSTERRSQSRDRHEKKRSGESRDKGGDRKRRRKSSESRETSRSSNRSSHSAASCDTSDDGGKKMEGGKREEPKEVGKIQEQKKDGNIVEEVERTGRSGSPIPVTKTPTGLDQVLQQVAKGFPQIADEMSEPEVIDLEAEVDSRLVVAEDVRVRHRPNTKLTRRKHPVIGPRFPPKSPIFDVPPPPLSPLPRSPKKPDRVHAATQTVAVPSVIHPRLVTTRSTITSECGVNMTRSSSGRPFGPIHGHGDVILYGYEGERYNCIFCNVYAANHRVFLEKDKPPQC